MSRTDTVSRAEAMLREASDRMMTSNQKARLRHAFRLERGSNKDRAEARQICADIEAELQGGIAESIALEQARGGRVEAGSGPVRMVDHDGLRSLLSVKDGLTAEQYDAGMAFREAWEARSGDLGSQLGGEGGAGGVHVNDRYVKARLARAKKLQRLGAIIRAVAVECAAEPAALQMLQEVAGEGKALSAFGEGRAFARHLAALKMALEVAAGCR